MNPYSFKELEPKPSMSTNSIILANVLILPAIGIEPIPYKRSDFKSDVSTNFTKQAMPQFDYTTLFSVTASVGLCWAVYYSFFSITLLSEIIILAKFRTKLSEQSFASNLNNVSLPGIFLYKNLIKFTKK